MTDAKSEQYGNFSVSTSFGRRSKFAHDKKFLRPENAYEALILIDLCFAEQKWDEDEQRRYFEMLGVGGMETNEDIWKILRDMDKSKMILFNEEERTAATGEIISLFADGGVIKKNPSPIGGTWAFCGIDAGGNRIIEKSGVVPATQTRTISNNHTEQIAITLALEAMPDGWSGTVHSDSMIALGRVFKNWRENNLPANISERSRAAVARLGKIKTVLLQGHPTKADLECGIGKKRGLPVSEHNVFCDKACWKAAEEYLQSIQIETA